MALLVEILLLAVTVALLTGGSLRRLSAERLVAEWVLAVALPLQVSWPRISAFLGISCTVRVVIWLTMMSLLVIVLTLNAGRRWALGVAALGVLLNILAIAANGSMPVEIARTSELGASRAEVRQALDDDCLHSEVGSNTRFPYLGDVIAVPGPPWHRSVVSFGDILLAVGLGGWIISAARNTRSGASSTL